MALFVWALWGLAAGAQAAPTLSAVSGSVFVMRAGSRTWQPAALGAALEPEDQVRTAASGRATITFDDASRVSLGANAALTVQDSSDEGVLMKLSLGSLRAWVTKALSRRFEVRTPTAVCSVRGTEFSVEVNPQGHTAVQMFSGVLAVSDQRGNETLIRDRESLRVTDKGFAAVQHQGPAHLTTGQERLRDMARREVGLEMTKEAAQSAAALEAMNAVYKEGKALIDVNGNRVRLEEYIVRPAPDEFKLVVLNERTESFNYFFYHGVFNTTLPDDLSVALRQLPGCIGSACQYYLKAYDTGRSNTQDNMLEVATGGHQVDVNNDGYAGDAVTAAFDPRTNQFTNLAPNQPFYQTLYNYNTLTFNGVPHNGWSSISGGDITNMGPSQIDATKVRLDINDPLSLTSPTTLTTVQNSPTCAPPDCTYSEANLEHQVFYAANGDGTVWDKYENYTISDEGRVAKTSDFLGTTSGADFERTLLHWNFETVVTASEFSGRKIDLVVEPKIFIESGLIQ